MMKYLFLFISILSPIQTALASVEMRPSALSAAIQAGIQNRSLNAADMEYLMKQGVRSFDLRSFAGNIEGNKPTQDPIISTRMFRVNEPGSINEGALVRNIGTRANDKIKVTMKDPTSGETLAIEVPWKYNPEGSPEAIYEEYKKHVTTKPNIREMVHNFPMESTVFLYGVGLASVVSLIADAEHDPRAVSRFLEGLKDPMFYASLVTFIIGNRYSNHALNSLLFSVMASKRMSPKAQLRISKILIPQLAMAGGGLLSNVTHDLWTLTKGCADYILRQKPMEEREKVCGEAAKQVFSNENSWRYATATLAMVTSGFLLSYGPAYIKAFGKAAVGRVAMVRNIAIRISTVAKWFPAPQARLLIWFRNATYGAIHLAAFLKWDEWVFYPFYHNLIEKRSTLGPKFLTHQQELLNRLDKTQITTFNVMDADSQKRYDAYVRQSIQESGDVRRLFGPKPTPVDLKLNYIGVGHDMRFGGVPQTHRPLSTLESTFNWTLGFVWPDIRDNLEKSLDFNDLLQKHAEASDLWRQSLLAPLQRQFQAWYEMIGPFNAVTQMTYDFYNDFYKEAAKINEYNKPFHQLKDRHILLHEDILANITPRGLDGSPTDDVIFKDDFGQQTDKGFLLTSTDVDKINTIRQSVCWIDGLLKHNDREIQRIDTSKDPLVRGRSVYHKMFRTSFQKIRASFAQFPEDIVCVGNRGTLKRARTQGIDMHKIHLGLLELVSVLGKYPQKVNLFDDELRITREEFEGKGNSSDKISSNSFEEDDAIYLNINYLENLFHYLGGVTPYERGERFIAEWDKTFKEQHPDYVKLLNQQSPAGELLRLMTCPYAKGFAISTNHSATPPVQRFGTPKPLIQHNMLDRFMGNITFNPPPVVNNLQGTACQGAFGNLLNGGFAFYNQTPNPRLGNVFDYVLADTKMEIFGTPSINMQNFVNYLARLASMPVLQDTPVESFFVKFKTQINGSPNRFTNWWDNNIEPQITAKFVEITDSYNKGLQDNMVEIVKEYDGRLNLNVIPESLTLSYLGQLSLYMDFILKVYRSKASDPIQLEMANKLKQEILGSVKKELEDAVNLSLGKDDITRNHAYTLALLKKFKALVQTRGFNIQSPILTSSDPKAVEFRDALGYYREKMGHRGDIYTEWINDLEMRVKGEDEFMNQAFRDSIEEVGKNYEKLKPIFLSTHFRGNGIQPVKELFNLITGLSASVYGLTKLTRLTTTSNFKELDKNGQDLRSKGSRRGY